MDTSPPIGVIAHILLWLTIMAGLLTLTGLLVVGLTWPVVACGLGAWGFWVATKRCSAWALRRMSPGKRARWERERRIFGY